MIIDESGTIHDLPLTSEREQEDNDLLEALALSLSLTTLNNDAPAMPADSPALIPAVSKPRPPAPPIHARPPPPFPEPTLRQRVQARFNLPALAPPVFRPERIRGLVPRELDRPHRAPRQFFPLPSEGFCYFPTRYAGYGPVRRNPPPRSLGEVTDSDPDDVDDATSTASTAPSL